MKANYRRLAIIMKWFPDAFYTITFSEFGITLQGYFSPIVIKNARLHKFTHELVDENGYLNMSRGNVEITLTER
jgi:hypothetical protein